MQEGLSKLLGPHLIEYLPFEILVVRHDPEKLIDIIPGVIKFPRVFKGRFPAIHFLENNHSFQQVVLSYLGVNGLIALKSSEQSLGHLGYRQGLILYLRDHRITGVDQAAKVKIVGNRDRRRPTRLRK